MDNEILKEIEIAQKSEITEHVLYLKLSQSIKDEHNKKVLKEISDDELGHYNFFKMHSQKETKPKSWEIFKYYWISKIFGMTFGIKMMENSERTAQNFYEKIAKTIPEIQRIIDDEEKHEKELINLIKEEKLNYIGSIVLGLNDALVELTGTLAGFTLAFQNSRIIALAGLITGVAAALSMAASEYLSQKHDADEGSNPFRASIYTGITYIFTVVFLVLPFFLFQNVLMALTVTLIIAVLIIFAFNFYISVAKDLPFKKRFWEMTIISLTVASLSFLIGYVLNKFLGINV